MQKSAHKTQLQLHAMNVTSNYLRVCSRKGLQTFAHCNQWRELIHSFVPKLHFDDMVYFLPPALGHKRRFFSRCSLSLVSPPSIMMRKTVLFLLGIFTLCLVVSHASASSSINARRAAYMRTTVVSALYSNSRSILIVVSGDEDGQILQDCHISVHVLWQPWLITRVRSIITFRTFKLFLFVLIKHIQVFIITINTGPIDLRHIIIVPSWLTSRRWCFARFLWCWSRDKFPPLLL